VNEVLLHTKELCDFIAENTGYASVDPSCRIDQLVSDSLEFLSMMLDIQTKFNKLIPDEIYPKLKTVADIGRALFEVQG
jgi:acyl carrier protein